MARPTAALVITEMERQALDSIAHRSRTAPPVARRARIVLACASGLDNTTVAQKLRMSKPTIGRWRQRFVDQRLDGLLDEPRPGTPRKIGDAQVEEVVTRTLESTPRGATHWSTRTLAKVTGVSPSRTPSSGSPGSASAGRCFRSRRRSRRRADRSSRSRSPSSMRHSRRPRRPRVRWAVWCS